MKKGVSIVTQEILFVIPGAGDEMEGRPAMIEPDTTAADLLRAANLSPDRYQLQVKQGEKMMALGSQDRVATYVTAGDKVFAVPADMTVGSAN